MTRPTPTRYFIGLDPGQQTGFAVWDAVEGRFAVLKTSTFWEAIALVERYPAAGVVVVIEDPAKNRTTFNHGTPRTLKAARRREKISRDVGQNQREARLLATGLERNGYRVQRVRPRSSKTGEAHFKRLTRYQGRTSQHSRDAAMLVFGLKRVPAEPGESPGELSLTLYAPLPAASPSTDGRQQ